MTDNKSYMILKQNIDYQNWVNQIKQKIKSAQYRAALSVNSVLLELYWETSSSSILCNSKRLAES